MIEENNRKKANEIYGTLCKVLDSRDWVYEKDEEHLILHFGVSGDDLPIQIIFVIDADREIIRLLSPMPFKMGDYARVEGSLATCIASNSLIDGTFDYDMSDGSIVFRMTASFKDSIVGTGLFEYMIDCSCVTIGRYNGQFDAINKGEMSIEDMLTKKD